MKVEKSWREIVKNAKLYLKLGQIEHYLSGNNDSDYPWELAEKCEPGGSHRMDISTNVWFSGNHPSGLKFRWSYDIEPHSANGASSYKIDTIGARRVLKQLPAKAAMDFRLYLNQCALAVRKSADKFQAVADTELATANILMELSR